MTRRKKLIIDQRDQSENCWQTSAAAAEPMDGPGYGFARRRANFLSAPKKMETPFPETTMVLSLPPLATIAGKMLVTYPKGRSVDSSPSLKLELVFRLEGNAVKLLPSIRKGRHPWTAKKPSL